MCAHALITFFVQPLHFAVKKKRIDFIRHMVKIKSLSFLVRDVTGSTPLQFAVRHGYAQIAQLFVDSGPSDALYMEDGVGNTPLEVATCRNLFHQIRTDLPRLLTTPPMLKERFDIFKSNPPFDIDRLEVEIPRLKQTIETLTRDGKLRNGTKLANELAIFSQKMEARLITAKSARDADAKAAADKNENASSKDNNKDGDESVIDSCNRGRTFQVIKAAVSACPGPRRLVHLHDVHESVHASLRTSLEARASNQDNHRDEGFEPELQEDVVAKQSALLHWSALSSFNNFPRNKVDLA